MFFFGSLINKKKTDTKRQHEKQQNQKMSWKIALHVFLLLASMVGLGMVSWALNRKKIAEHNKHPEPTRNDQALAFALGLGWWAAFALVYFAVWRGVDSNDAKHKFSIVLGIMLITFVGVAAVSAVPTPVFENVYANYGFSFVGPIIVAIAFVAVAYR